MMKYENFFLLPAYLDGLVKLEAYIATAVTFFYLFIYCIYLSIDVFMYFLFFIPSFSGNKQTTNNKPNDYDNNTKNKTTTITKKKKKKKKSNE